MYIGGVGSAGLHHLVWEILDNAVDEAMNGFASTIAVTLHERRVDDHGRPTMGAAFRSTSTRRPTRARWR